MPKIQQGTASLFLNLPKQYCKLLNWTKGTEIVVIPQDKGLLLKEMPKEEKP